jgi:SAM-dependent methyltransferase
MAAVACRYLPAVEVAPFEAWDAADRAFDLAIAGQAWHWVDPVVGAARLAAVVKPGGRFGLSWNLGRHEDAIRPAIDAAYERAAPAAVRSSLGPVREDTDQYVEPIAAADAFEAVEERIYGWQHRYTRDEWLDQLPTHSDHRLLTGDDRARLLDAVGAVIDDFGGNFTMDFETVLITARRS